MQLTKLFIPLLFCLLPLTAQDAPKPETIANPQIALADLQDLVSPLTKAELKLEADAWQSLVREKVRAIGQSEIAARKLQGEERDQLLETVAALRDERTKLADRAQVVLTEWIVKGGDAKEHETYLAATSGMRLKADDASGAWDAILGWAKSDEGGLRVARNVGWFLVTLLAFAILGRILGGITRRAVTRFRGASELLRDFLANVVRKITVLIGIVVALSMLEVNIGPLVAGIGALGFIVGFAVQGTLSNFAAGIMILLYRPYDIGDTVTVAGVTGHVQSMTLVSTSIKTEAENVTIPNNSIWGGVIKTSGAKRAG